DCCHQPSTCGIESHFCNIGRSLLRSGRKETSLAATKRLSTSLKPTHSFHQRGSEDKVYPTHDPEEHPLRPIGSSVRIAPGRRYVRRNSTRRGAPPAANR